MTTTTTDLPLLLATVEVTAVERLSPSFVRIELGAPALAELARDGHSYDQRLKLVFPDGDGPVPSFESSDESWYVDWSSRPVAERGHMRTYTLRAVRGEGVDTRLVVDFALHGASAGPGGSWGARARIGDRLAVVAPRRGHAFGGIEFEPGSATDVLLVGDETAVPAIAAILEQLDHAVSVTAFLEVPLTADILDLPRRPGVSVDWLPRNGAPRGAALHAAVLEHLGVRAEVPELSDDEVDPALWETPRRTSADSGSHTYAWIAGESKVVTGLRRVLVKDLGFDRSSVAFMGYWRDGVAMKS
jgi:NADPH-dependent ferric siderophore reductase